MVRHRMKAWRREHDLIRPPRIGSWCYRSVAFRGKWVWVGIDIRHVIALFFAVSDSTVHVCKAYFCTFWCLRLQLGQAFILLTCATRRRSSSVRRLRFGGLVGTMWLSRIWLIASWGSFLWPVTAGERFRRRELELRVGEASDPRVDPWWDEDSSVKLGQGWWVLGRSFWANYDDNNISVLYNRSSQNSDNDQLLFPMKVLESHLPPNSQGGGRPTLCGVSPWFLKCIAPFIFW